MADTEALRAAFDQFDVNKDGTISVAEFRTVLAGVGQVELTEAQAQALLSVADTDGDGRMSWDEFLAARNAG